MNTSMHARRTADRAQTDGRGRNGRTSRRTEGTAGGRTTLGSKAKKSLGPQPSAWQTPSPCILPVVLLIIESAREAAPRPPIPKVTTLEPALALFFGPARFFDFLVHREGVQK